MKAQMKAIGAMAVVVALALVAVSGVTYSWFSDSETSDIDISTAKIDIDGKYTGTPVVKDLDGNDVPDTKAGLINDDKDISITNMLSSRSVTANYELTNKSTVPIKYRMYVVVSGIDDTLAEKSIKVAAGTDNTLSLNASLDFDKGIAYVTSADGVTIDNTGKFVFDIEISFDTTVGSSSISESGFSVKIYNEAYQYDFAYAPVSTMASGSADLPVSGKQTADVKVVGKTGAESGVKAADVEVTFSAGAYNVATGDGAKQVTLKTTMLSSSGNAAKIQLSLEGEAKSDFEGNYVTVSLVIPGVFSDLNVVYPAGESQPEIVSCTNDGTNTTVVFKTTHFSDYVIYKDKLYVDSEDMLKFALSNGIDAVLTNDIVIKDTIYATTVCKLDLNGHEISNTTDIWYEKGNWSLISVRNGGDLTISGDGGIIAKENDCFAVDIQDGSRCTINGGKYVGNLDAAYVLEGSLIINGGSFSIQQLNPSGGREFTINCLDENYKNGIATVEITGGTFYKFNPADCKAEGANTNFVKAGYCVIDEGDNYIVSKYKFTGDNVVFDGETYYMTMVAALEGIHKTDKHVLWCKPGANLGAMTHGHVCTDITIYGNGAYISSGERDFEIDTYKKEAKCTDGVTSDVTLTVYSLNNMAVWGQRNTAYTINIILEDCKDMNRVYLSGQTGLINVTIRDCSFNGDIASNATALYTNAVGTITVENTIFNKYTLGVNQNNKSGGLQTITLTNCVFNDCGYAYQADWSGFCSPVRIVASADGSESVLTTDNCVFNNSVGKETVRNSNYLFGDDRKGESVLGTVTFNGKVVEQIKPSAN